MKLKPMNDYVLIRRNVKSATSLGGIILPDDPKTRSVEGMVVEVGSGKYLPDGTRAPPALKEGDMVLFGRYAGTDIDMNGETLVMMREQEVVGVFDLWSPGDVASPSPYRLWM